MDELATLEHDDSGAKGRYLHGHKNCSDGNILCAVFMKIGRNNIVLFRCSISIYPASFPPRAARIAIPQFPIDLVSRH